MLEFIPAKFGRGDKPDAPERKGVIAQCDCGCRKFLVFQLEGQNHIHLECFACSESYCPAGDQCN